MIRLLAFIGRVWALPYVAAWDGVMLALGLTWLPPTGRPRWKTRRARGASGLPRASIVDGAKRG